MWHEDYKNLGFQISLLINWLILGITVFILFRVIFHHKKEHESDTLTENHNLLVFDTSNSTQKTENKNGVSWSPLCLTAGGLLFLSGLSDESEFPLSGLRCALSWCPKWQNKLLYNM